MSLIPWTLIGVGAYALIRVRHLEKDQTASRTWPRVTGRLLRVRPKDLSGNFDDELLIPLVQYEYRVGETLHRSCEIDFSGEGALEPEAFDRKMEGLERGAPVTVYYDPEDPSRAVLRPGTCGQEELGQTSLIGLGLLAAGLVVLAVELGSGRHFFDALRLWLGA